MRRRLRLAVLPLAAALLGACASSPTEIRFAPALRVDLDAMTRTASGLYLQDLVAGTGAVAGRTSRVVVHYTGWLPNGTRFDTSRERGQPLEVTLGQGAVIRGWDEGIVGMKVGGVRRLVIPPHLAYGNRGAGNVIPPNATLVFEIELLALR